MSFNKNAEKTEVRGLICEVRDGSQPAFSSLLALYEPMICSAVKQFSAGRQDADDLRQEALTVFYRAIMTYDLERREVEFGLYAKICVTNALISLARAERRRARSNVVSIEYEEYLRYRADADAREDPAGRVIERENEKALRELIKKNLSVYENSVWSLYMSGLTSREISRRLSRPEKSIDNALCRIKRKLRLLLEK